MTNSAQATLPIDASTSASASTSGTLFDPRALRRVLDAAIERQQIHVLGRTTPWLDERKIRAIEELRRGRR